MRTRIYRVKVTNAGAVITFEGEQIHVVPDQGNFDRHLAMALDYLKLVEKRQWLVIKSAPQAGIPIMTTVLTRESIRSSPSRTSRAKLAEAPRMTYPGFLFVVSWGQHKESGMSVQKLGDFFDEQARALGCARKDDFKMLVGSVGSISVDADEYLEHVQGCPACAKALSNCFEGIAARLEGSAHALKGAIGRTLTADSLAQAIQRMSDLLGD